MNNIDRVLCNHDNLLYILTKGDKKEFMCLDCCANIELSKKEYSKRKILYLGENISQDTIIIAKNEYDEYRRTIKLSRNKK